MSVGTLPGVKVVGRGMVAELDMAAVIRLRGTAVGLVERREMKMVCHYFYFHSPFRTPFYRSPNSILDVIMHFRAIFVVPPFLCCH